MRCIHPSQRCVSSRQMTDNIFEIETTALAHVTCAPQGSGILLTNFAAAYPSVNHSWIFSVCAREHCVARFSLPVPAWYLQQHHARGIRGSRPRTIPYGQRCKTGLSSEWLPFCDGFRPCLQMAPRGCYPKEPRQPGILAACPVRLRRRSRCCINLFSVFNDCIGICIPFCGFHCWLQFELSQMLLGSVWH